MGQTSAKRFRSVAALTATVDSGETMRDSVGGTPRPLDSAAVASYSSHVPDMFLSSSAGGRIRLL